MCFKYNESKRVRLNVLLKEERFASRFQDNQVVDGDKPWPFVKIVGEINVK